MTIRLWPRSLLGRVALIVCGALTLTHALTFFIILRERGDQGMAMMLAYVGRDVASSMAILDRVPPDERGSWLPRLARQNYQYQLGQLGQLGHLGGAGQSGTAVGSPEAAQAAARQGPALNPTLAHALAEVIASQLGAGRVGMPLQSTQAGQAPRLLLPLRLADGTQVLLSLAPPSPMVSRTTIWLLCLQLLALALAAWFSVRQTVKPLTLMADAANALRPGLPTPALPEHGPTEVETAARAFNAMQGRIDTHLNERMQLLAAISHDLQTPITRLRLRGEHIADEALRAKVMADLDGMQALVEEGLAYARTAQAVQEAARPVDLHALLDGLVCDAVDAGHTVELIGRHEAPLVTRVQALRRVLVNLIDNAVKFGGATKVIVSQADGTVRIAIQDRGPGIPAAELEAVRQPFYRVESSRNRETGGTGLGLAIADQLTQALSGTLTLRNRTKGGLQATLTLPA